MARVPVWLVKIALGLLFILTTGAVATVVIVVWQLMQIRVTQERNKEVVEEVIRKVVKERIESAFKTEKDDRKTEKDDREKENGQ